MPETQIQYNKNTLTLQLIQRGKKRKKDGQGKDKETNKYT